MFNFTNDGKMAKLYIYGTIGGFYDGVTKKEVAEALDEFDGEDIEVHIDSPGGDVYEGFAIASNLASYSGKKTCIIDGLAASAASYIALMCNEIQMQEYAQFMIHNAWTYTYGNANELECVIERLRSLDENIATVISKRTLLTLEEAKEKMSAETWLSASEAEELGFCDSVLETEERLAAFIPEILLAKFKNAPEEVKKSHAENKVKEPEKRLLGNRLFTV